MTTRERSAVIIGGGINGLVAANYLARAGVRTTLLERKAEVGGAAVNATVEIDGRTFTYPLGATLLGQMQRFVFEETGLAARLRAGPSPHPALYRFPDDKEPVYFHADPARFRNEISRKWGEDGWAADAFEHDCEKVTDFLQHRYRHAMIPSLADAELALGKTLSNLWVRGSVRGLADHYFPDNPKLALSFLRNAIESGPVPIDEPESAFTVALTSAGSVFGGKWGFVAGGMGKLVEELASIDRELGVNIVTGAHVRSVDPNGPFCNYTVDGKDRILKADHIIFATDPMTAANIVGDGGMIAVLKEKRYAGTSGKLIMLFRDPVRWKYQSGIPGIDSAMKFFMVNEDLESLERSSRAAAQGTVDLVPGYYEVYSEGAGLRLLGDDRGYESVMVFFKHASWRNHGDDLSGIRDMVKGAVCAHMHAPREPIFMRLLMPKDLTREFFFPGGNIDHMMICAGQTGSSRTYGSFGPASYGFGRWQTLSYCGAGAFPCGSVTGTPGYMCATELLRSHLK